MKLQRVLLIPALCLLPSIGMAQKWEFGAAGGGSFYTSSTVTAANNSTVDAKFNPGFNAGVVFGQNNYKFFGGELRYSFIHNEMELSGSGGKATFSGQAHAIHYDFLVHAAPVGATIRPFVAGGAGVKLYRGTGTEVVSQPLSSYALLTKTSEVKPMVSFGAGVKIRMSDRVQLRVELRDYVTPFPKNVIAPNNGAKVSGWIHDFMPMFGISYLF
jgi:Outer membrane protein beta-barrel domain